MKLVLDTNAYTAIDSQSLDEAYELISDATSIFLPTVVYGELFYGFMCGRIFEKNHSRLEVFIKEFDVHLIDIDKAVAEKYGQIHTSLRSKGRPIPANDIWIAACCMHVGGTLLTADRHFLDVDQVLVRIF